MALIEVKDLVKNYEVYKHRRGLTGALRDLFDRQRSIVKALDGVDFTIEEGELIGYVGPNGAGKSTTLKVLTGILVPTSGTVTVRGRIPWKERVENARRMGVVFGQRTQLMWDIPAIESFHLARHLYRVPEDLFKKNLDMFVELLEMESFMDRPVRQLSLGQKMRCELAGAFLHGPDIVYLDEPTIGLDVVAKERIRRFLRSVNKDLRVTIILTTHDMNDVEQVCRRLLMIDRGRIIWDGDLEDIKNRFGGKVTLTVEFESEPDQFSPPEGSQVTKEEGSIKWIEFNRNQVSIVGVIQKIVGTHQIRDLTFRETSVEEIVRNIYEKTGISRGSDQEFVEQESAWMPGTFKSSR